MIFLALDGKRYEYLYEYFGHRTPQDHSNILVAASQQVTQQRLAS